jgi:ADP-ribose pyrophosphatase
MYNSNQPRITQQETKYSGKTIKVQAIEIDLANGNVVNWERAKYNVANNQGSVGILPLTSQGKLLLIKYFHPGSEKEEIVFPGGGVKLDQTEKQAVVAELIEETGYRPQKTTFLTTVKPLPGYFVCNTQVYLAEDLVADSSLQGDELETIQILELYPEEIIDLIKTGQIQDARTLAIFFFWYNLHFKANLDPSLK